MRHAEVPFLPIDKTKYPDLQMLLDYLKEAEQSTPEVRWREVAMEDYRFYAGKQDDDEVIALLEAQNRPTVVFNEIKPKVDMLIGIAAQSKTDGSVIPVGSEDEPLAEVVSGMLKHFRRQQKLARKELECFEHTVKSGRALLHFYIDKSNPFTPKVCAKRIPGWMFFTDPNSIEYDLSDSRYLFIDRWVTEDEVKNYWPGVDPGLLQSFYNNYPDYPSFFNEGLDLFRIVEAWYYKLEEVIWFQNPFRNGEAEYLTKAEFKKFRKAAAEGMVLPGPDGQPVQQKPVDVQGYSAYKKVYYYAIFSGMEWLEGGKSPFKWDGFPSVLFGAYKNEDENRWFGAISVMKDPQMALNTMRRQYAHLLQTLPKGILVHESGAIINIDEYEKRASDPTFHMEVIDGGISKYKFETQPSISPVYQVLDGIYSQSMKDSSGIQDPMLGNAMTSREPGVTMRMKQESGLAVLYTLYDNFKESRHQAGRIFLSLLQQYVTYPTLIRIEGDNGAQLIEINSQMNPGVEGFNDISAGEFDLVYDEVVETPTMRGMIGEILADFARNNPGVVPPDIILEYQNVPWTAKQRVKTAYEGQMAAAAANTEREFALREKEIEIKSAQVGVKHLDVKARAEAAKAKGQEKTSTTKEG